MFESESKLRHLPFFEEVGSHTDGSPEWRAATAGLLVLRLVDTWMQDGPLPSRDHAWAVRHVKSALDELSEGNPHRMLLARVVEALHRRKPDIYAVITPLMAYAQALEFDAKWFLAADVYHSVLAHLHPLEDGDASIAAHLRLGQCYRNLNRFDDALDSYASASEVATANHDMVGTLRARVGEGQIFMLRGNLPAAETILEETITRARDSDLRDVRSRALHVRSNVAQLRGQYETAIRYAYQALSNSESATERDRILSDIAVAFLELGVYTAASDAYLVLSTTAQEQYIRWAAVLNLLEIASLTGAEVQFEMYRREIIREELPPYLATGLELNVGTGYQRFGNPVKAVAHLQKAVVLATEHGLNQFLFMAEEALRNVHETKPPRSASNEVALDVQEVASAIRELRETVGVT